MIFVPLPLVATFCLLVVLLRMVMERDMTLRANQLFAALVGLYAVQSLLLSLRWGYQLEAAGFWAGLLAPVLPVLAYFAYLSLIERLSRAALWPVGVIALNWVVLIAIPDLADILILLTYLCFGGAILWNASRRAPALVRFGQTQLAFRAMMVTGLALVCSAMMDVYVIVDFIRTGGANIGLVATMIQTGFILCIGLAAVLSPSGVEGDADMPVEAVQKDITEEDDVIIARLTQLFETERLHGDMELNLRRLSRRLGLPDRAVSQAINKTQNMSVSQFVNRFRIQDACKMLQETDQSVLQISLAAGFMSKSNFNREFARITGRTPTQWRQSPPSA